jgi:hypothetical protein
MEAGQGPNRRSEGSKWEPRRGWRKFIEWVGVLFSFELQLPESVKQFCQKQHLPKCLFSLEKRLPFLLKQDFIRILSEFYPNSNGRLASRNHDFPLEICDFPIKSNSDYKFLRWYFKQFCQKHHLPKCLFSLERPCLFAKTRFYQNSDRILSEF